MSQRSTPRIVPGARLGAHRTINLTLVINDAPLDPPATHSGAPSAPEEPAKPASGAFLAGLKSRLPGLPPIRPAVWLSDILVPERNSFGVLRLLMALAVLVSHAFFLVSGDTTTEPLYRWTGYTLGQHGVQVFFFLSGILVTQSLMKSESVRDYAIARGLRIFPALTVCVLLTAVVAGPWLTTLAPAEYLKDKAVAAYIVKTLSLMTGSAPLPGVFENAPGAAKGIVNSSLWTLKYEVLCYVALASIGWIAIRTKAYRSVAAAGIAGWLALVMYNRVGIEAGSVKSAFEVFRYFALFFGAGAATYVLARWIPIHGLVLVPLLAVLAASIGTRFAEPAMALTFGYGALWLATFDFWGLRGYTNHSDYSYGTYIYGMPVSQALLMLVPGMHVLSLILVTAGIVLLLSFLSWEAVERPALALRHRFRKAEAEAATMPVATEEPKPVVPATPAAKVTPIRKPVAAPTSAPPQAASAAAHSPTPKTSSTEPGVARPWRPVSQPIRLQVARDGKETSPAREPQQPPPAAPDVPKSRLSFALNRGKATLPPTSKPANDPGATMPGYARKVTDAAAPHVPKGPRPRPSWRPLRPL